MPTTNKLFGIADPQYDALRVLSTQALQVGPGDGSSLPGGGLENKIYLWPADGSTISVYDPTQVGLVAALAAAVSGDTVILPSIPIALTTGVTLIAGSALRGISENSILSFSGFTGTAITMAAGAICDHFTFTFTPSGNNSIGLDARFSGALVNHIRGSMLGSATGCVGAWMGA